MTMLTPYRSTLTDEAWQLCLRRALTAPTCLTTALTDGTLTHWATAPRAWPGGEDPQDRPTGAVEACAIDLDAAAVVTLADAAFVELWTLYLRRRWLIYRDHPDEESQAIHLHQLAIWPDRMGALRQSIDNSWKKILPPKQLLSTHYVKTGRLLAVCRADRDAKKRRGRVADSITGYVVRGADARTPAVQGR